MRNITREGKEAPQFSSDTIVNREIPQTRLYSCSNSRWLLHHDRGDAKLEHGTGAIRKANLYDPSTISPPRFDPSPGVAGKVSNWPRPARGDEPQATVARAGAIHIK